MQEMLGAAQNLVADWGEPGSSRLSPRKLAEALHVGIAELASIVGASRATLSRLPVTAAADRALSPVARILVMATEMSGAADRAALWFKHQPLPGWAGKTGRDLVAEGKAQAVIDYLEATRAGVYA